MQNSSPPSILLTTTLRWPIAARLAIAFTNMGCRTEVLCPGQHPVAKTRAIRKIYPYSALKPLASLYGAIKSAAPDLIIPCDDDAAIQLHQLYINTSGTSPAANTLRVLITRSLGTPEACTLATTRGQLMALAAGEGIRIPETIAITASNELNSWFAQHPFPAVIKTDRSWGGQGVSIVRNQQEALHALSMMTSPPTVMNAIVRLLLDRDLSFFLNLVKATRRDAIIQNFIPGIPANRAVACWQGQVLAGISVEAIRTQHQTGPATVVRVIENPEMSEAVNRLVRRLEISGLWGIDFILEESTKIPYLIEINPRATPICHLPLGMGRNLPAALYMQLTGSPPIELPTMIDHDVIALFPGEWHRDPESSYLRSNYHDIPWDESGLIQECINRPWSERGWIARLWAKIRSKSFVQPIIRKKNPKNIRISLHDTHDYLRLNKFKAFASSTLTSKKTTFIR